MKHTIRHIPPLLMCIALFTWHDSNKTTKAEPTSPTTIPNTDRTSLVVPASKMYQVGAVQESSGLDATNKKWVSYYRKNIKTGVVSIGDDLEVRSNILANISTTNVTSLNPIKNDFEPIPLYIIGMKVDTYVTATYDNAGAKPFITNSEGVAMYKDFKVNNVTNHVTSYQLGYFDSSGHIIPINITATK